jgi:hypothetical protein
MAMESYFVSLLEMSGAKEIVLLRDRAPSVMDGYFVSLLEMSGAEEIVLLRDRASSTCLLEDEKKKDMMFRRTVSLPSYGPPSHPLRKTSSDNLHEARAGNRSKKTSSKKPDALKDFFDEVAPGMRPRPKSRERSKTNNKNWSSKQDQDEGGPSAGDSLNSKSALGNVFSDIVQSHDDHRARRGHEGRATKVNLKELLEEVEDVMEGSRASLNMGTSRKESRWT